MASGDTLAVLQPHGSFPPSTNMATLNTRNAVPVLDFDQTTDETIYWKGLLPRNYSGGGLTVIVHWMGATGLTSGSVVWEVGIERRHASGDDLDSDTFATNQFAQTTTSGTSGVTVTTSIPFTSGAQMDSLAAGDPFRLRLVRDANGTNGTDSMAGDAQVECVEIKET